MSSTQRSESMNSFFKGYLSSKTSLQQFVKQYDNALRDKTEKETLADFACYGKNLPPVSGLQVEKQYIEVYTHEIVKKIQKEIKAMISCNVERIESVGSKTIYAVTDYNYDHHKAEDEESSLLILRVKIDDDNEVVDCICNFYYFKGYPCRHMFSAMMKHDMRRIPDTYILDRWRKDVSRNYKHLRHARDDRGRDEFGAMYDELTEIARESIEHAIYDKQKFTWLKAHYLKGRNKVVGAMSTFVGIFSPRKKPKRGRPPTQRWQSTAEKATKKKVYAVHLDIIFLNKKILFFLHYRGTKEENEMLNLNLNQNRLVTPRSFRQDRVCRSSVMRSTDHQSQEVIASTIRIDLSTRSSQQHFRVGQNHLNLPCTQNQLHKSLHMFPKLNKITPT